MLGLSEKQMTIITVSALVLVLLAGGGAVYYLQFVVIAEKKASIEEVEGKIAEEKKKLKPMEDFRQEIIASQRKIDSVKTVIPTMNEGEYDSLQKAIKELEQRAGVEIPSGRLSLFNRTNPMGGGLPGDVFRVDYNLPVSGSFQNIIKFFNVLETYDRFVHIQRFSVAPLPDAPDKCSVPLTISTYLFRGTTTPKPVAGQVKSILSETTPIPE